MTAYPIEIIGGGLAGLSLGLALRRVDVDVTIFDAGSYPRHRVCGEFIAGLDELTVARLGLAPFLSDALTHHTVGWFLDDLPIKSQRLPVPALGISRFALDARLADAFAAAGGELRTGSRVEPTANISGRVWATGRAATRSPWLGLKVHALNLPLSSDLEVHLGDHAYVGISRVEDGAVNICGLFRRRAQSGLPPAKFDQEFRASDARRNVEVLFHFLTNSGLGGVARRLGAAQIQVESFCSVAALEFAPRPSPPDRVCIGDRWAMTPPFTGNGMAMAFQAAALVIEPLRRYAAGEATWPDVCRECHAGLRARFRFRLKSAGLLHPFLLQPARQRWLAALTRARLLPLQPLYAALH